MFGRVWLVASFGFLVKLTILFFRCTFLISFLANLFSISLLQILIPKMHHCVVQLYQRFFWDFQPVSYHFPHVSALTTSSIAYHTPSPFTSQVPVTSISGELLAKIASGARNPYPVSASTFLALASTAHYGKLNRPGPASSPAQATVSLFRSSKHAATVSPYSISAVLIWTVPFLFFLVLKCVCLTPL